MSAFQIINGTFVVGTNLMNFFNIILMYYEILISNDCSTESIELLISKWTTSANLEEESHVRSINYSLQRKSNEIMFKHMDESCSNITTFKRIYQSFLTNELLLLVQKVIDMYIIDAIIVKKALENLLPIIKLLCKIESITTLSSPRIFFVDKIRTIGNFIRNSWFHIIYREIYLAYLVQQRDCQLLRNSSDSCVSHSVVYADVCTPQTRTETVAANSETTILTRLHFLGTGGRIGEDLVQREEDADLASAISSSILESYKDLNHDGTIPQDKKSYPQSLEASEVMTTGYHSNINFVQYDIPSVVLNAYITNIDDINSIRSVSKSLLEHYSIKTMTNIAILNLSQILNKCFMLNTDKFTEAIISCGAVVAGSLVAQSFYGGMDSVLTESDCDLYIAENTDCSSLLDVIITSGYKLCNEDPLPEMTDSHFFSSEVSYRFNSNIISVSNYENNARKKIQVITVRQPATALSTFEFGKFVVSTYDLTFLKNFYDGINLYTYDFIGIVTKKGSVTPFVQTKIAISDAVTVNAITLSTWYRALTATIIRCLKYQKRGFTIDNVPDLSLVTELRI